jgi:ABC-type nickel/cobalt efflux system permease component RcnA
MRRALLLALPALIVLPASAQAHPLGNFSVNRLDVVSVSTGRVDVRYLLDQAEIPTFQERGLSRSAVLARKRAEVARGLELRVDGARVRLVLEPRGTLVYRPGQGGLRTSRVELRLHAAVHARRTVVVRDRTFDGRAGWKGIQVVAGRGTAVRSSAPAGDPTRGLTRYPDSLLSSPAGLREATLQVRAGDGEVTGPDGGHAAAGSRSGRDGFAALLAKSDGFILVLLLTAFGWGAVHALSPGHGKTMVAAYLVGTRGRPRDAVVLGATVTVTHTIGVFALGLITLALSAYVLPEDLYPWLELVSGLMVLGVGGAVLRRRLRDARRNAQLRDHRHQHGHSHGHDHGHDHGQDHGHDHGHDHGARGIMAMGASAGLVPCPSALVVLLGAVAQHQLALGLVLIVAFSTGLAATLTALGLLVVKAARLPAPPRLATILPAVSAVAIVVVGVVLTVRAIPSVVG